MKLFLVTVDAHEGVYGCELYALGIFSDEESAKAVKFAYETKYPKQTVTIDEMTVNEVLTQSNWIYLGEYIE